MGNKRRQEQVEPKRPRWTPAQAAAVGTSGRNVLVSASAGTGKTRVLVDRCLRLVLDEGVDLDRLLVVTFTDAAAAEMRERVRAEMQERLRDDPSSERLQSQLLFLDRAQISTIHSFCLRTLRENFHRIGLDPMFTVLDPDESDLLKDEIVAEIFEEYYSQEDEQGTRFQQLVDFYGGHDADAGLSELVIALHDFTRSLAEPEEWLAEAKRIYEEASEDRPLSEMFWFKEYRSHIERELEAAAKEYEFAIQALKGTDFEGAYGPPAAQILATITNWLADTGPDKLEQLCGEIREYSFPRLGSVKDADAQAKEEAQAIVHRGKKRIQNELQVGLCRDDFAAMREAVARVAPHVAFLVQLVGELAERFAEEKSRLATVDFSDLEQFMLRLLKDEEVAQAIRDRFEYVLVDEYQDINPVQDRILSTVSRAGDASRPGNLFVVGDVKQSIYRFRLAEPGIFVEKHKAYSDEQDAPDRRIYLKENFRSRKQVIEAINTVFGRIMHEEMGGIAYDKSAELVYAADYAKPSAALPPVEFHVLDLPKAIHRNTEDDEDDKNEGEDLDKIEAEAHFVADRIEQIVGGEKAEFEVYDRTTDAYRDATYRDIVVLLRTTRQRANAYTEALAERGIPVHADLGAGYFTSTEIEDMLNVLRVIDNPRQDIPLAAVLRSPIVGLSEPQLAEIRLACEDGDFYAALCAAAEQRGKPAERLQTFLNDLNCWRTVARQRPLAELIHTLYAETDYLSYVAGLRNGAQRQANLLRLHDRACQFDRFAHHGLARFLRFIEDLIEAGSDFGSAPVLSEAEDAVRVMSIHRSKGLEFPVVFLPDLAKGINFADTAGDMLYDRDLSIGARVIDIERGLKHSTIAHMTASRELKLHTLAEEMRILYVAMTRARERLILSAATDVRAMRNTWTPIVSATNVLPPFVLTDARRMLDWIWPAVAGAEGGESLRKEGKPVSSGRFLHTAIHDGDEIQGFAVTKRTRRAGEIDRGKVAKLEPLEDDAPPSPACERVKQQIEWRYPAIGLTRLRAKLSVSELKRRHDGSREEDELPARRRERLVEQPSFLTEDKGELTGAQRGTAVHTVMQFLDLSLDLGNPDTVRAQVEALRKQGLLTDAEAEAVDVDAVCRFFTSEPGAQMLRDPARVQREVPFTLGKKAGEVYSEVSGSGCDDTILVQGIIDCLIEEDDGFILIDFKTDRIRPEQIQERIEEGGYAAQLDIYADAAEQLFGKTILARHLCFLALGESVTV